MVELRILSGLHRGATLPLDERSHVIGASDDADVVIVDPDIAGQHASLTAGSSGWTLTTLEGEVRDAYSNQPHTTLTLAPGEFARVGAVWITVVDQGAGWSNPPPEPAEDLFDPNEPDDAPVPASAAASAATAAAATPAASTADHHPAPASQAKPHSAGARLKKRSGMIIVALGLVVVASAAGAYALHSSNLANRVAAAPFAHPVAPKAAARAEVKEAEAKPLLAGKTSQRPVDPTVAKAFDKVNEDTEAERPPTPEELRKAFRKRLADADLLKRFDLTLQDTQWTMQAALDDDETARFEHILAGFIKTYGITFPVYAKIGNGEAMLPFKIRQVVSGRDASVVTQDGDRLYVGDELRGVKLVAVRGNRLTFAGKRKIEIVW